MQIHRVLVRLNKKGELVLGPATMTVGRNGADRHRIQWHKVGDANFKFVNCEFMYADAPFENKQITDNHITCVDIIRLGTGTRCFHYVIEVEVGGRPVFSERPGTVPDPACGPAVQDEGGRGVIRNTN